MLTDDFTTLVEWFCGQMAEVQAILAMADGKTDCEQDRGVNQNAPRCHTMPATGDPGLPPIRSRQTTFDCT